MQLAPAASYALQPPAGGVGYPAARIVSSGMQGQTAQPVTGPGSAPAPAYAAAAPPGAAVYQQPQLPVVYGAPPVQPVGPPSKPPALTTGMPDPQAVEVQKAAYNRSLEEQAQQGEELLRMQQKQQVDYIYQAAEEQKRQLMLQIDQQAKAQELQLSQQYGQQVMSLQQEFQHQKLLLEKQASELAMEYQMRKSHEEMLEQQYQMQQAHYEEQARTWLPDIERVPLVPILDAAHLPNCASR
ncbi:unnamed protein product [Prorocentrum cordatum]|uniref:Uncharacterized protein n=1 Tax=Prorocentrum cordatum TaxID=2364126 RepID=A0ABN9VGF7_9DINO|nr:unnamed protein product [Polarella glacialis]